jgi:hypothetical protein
MPQNRIGRYADFALYPGLIAVMILVIADSASPVERAIALLSALAGASLWMLLDHLLHRFLQTPLRRASWQFCGDHVPLTGEGNDRIQFRQGSHRRDE